MSQISGSVAERIQVLERWQDAPPPQLDHAMVLTNAHVADRYWRLRILSPAIARSARPGQFVMVTVADVGETGPVLPRPMAVYSTVPEAGTFDILYGVIGDGTKALSRRRVGATLTVVGPLGRGFDLADHTTRLLLVGRGIGTCSLTLIAKEAVRRGIKVTALDSARTAHALVADGEYFRVGVHRRLQVFDSDGSSGVASVASLLRGAYADAPPDQVLTCGSRRLTVLADQLAQEWGADLQVSLEAHMACGLGYCHGCATGQRTPSAETPLICREGPVFRLGDMTRAGVPAGLRGNA